MQNCRIKKEVWVKSDALRFKQIIINLIGNAVKFTESGGKIDLIFTLPAAPADRVGVKIAVIDTGIGMTEEELKHLFQRFSQTTLSTGKNYEGSGLGLYLVKQMAMLMQGDITVTSRQGQGSTFSFDVQFEGSTALGALNALLGALPGNSSLTPDQINEFKRLMDSFQLGRLDTFDHPDEPQEMASELRRDEFGQRPSSGIWVVQSKTKSQNSNSEASALGLTDDQAHQLDTINQTQSELDIQERLLKKAQWDAYSLWWKKGHFKPQSTGIPSTVSIPKYLDFAKSAVQDQISKQQISIAHKNDALNAAIQSLKNSLSSPDLGYTLQKIPHSEFSRPQEPILLITGVNSANDFWSSVEKGVKCRLVGDCVQFIRLQNGSSPRDLPADNILPERMDTIEKDKLPPLLKNSALDALVKEFCLLDFHNSTTLAKSLSDQLKKTLKDDMKNPNQNPGIYMRNETRNATLPDLTLTRWQQSWNPLMVYWEIEWYSIPFSNWTFNGQKYNLTTLPSDLHSQLLTGTHFISPQAKYVFLGQLKRELAQSLTASPEPADWSEFKKLVDEWDIIVMPLNSLHDQLVQRSTQMNLIGSSEETFGNETHSTPVWLPSGKESFFPLQLVRHGQFVIRNLRVIDSFGLVRTAYSILPPPSTVIRPYISKNLQPEWRTETDSPFIQLAPRILQSCRLDADWLIDRSDTHTQIRALFACKGNPIQGWIMLSSLQSLKIYNPEGDFLGELSATRSQCVWTDNPTDPGRLSQYSVLYGFVNYFLQNSSSQPTLTSYKGLCDILQTAAKKKIISEQFIKYLITAVGQPLALASAQWQLQLDSPAYLDQSLAAIQSDLDSEKDRYQYDLAQPTTLSSFPQYQMSIQLGNTKLSKEGLVGYFLQQEVGTYNKFYTPYTSSITNFYVSQDRFALTPQTPGMGAYTTTTLLIDPFRKVSAYSDILPVRSLSLPFIFVQNALTKMSAFYSIGPILTLRDQSDKTPGTVYLPQPSKEGIWSFLEPVFKSTSTSPGIQSSVVSPEDVTPQLGLPCEIVTGWMQFTPTTVSSPSTTSSSELKEVKSQQFSKTKVLQQKINNLFKTAISQAMEGGMELKEINNLYYQVAEEIQKKESQRESGANKTKKEIKVSCDQPDEKQKQFPLLLSGSIIPEGLSEGINSDEKNSRKLPGASFSASYSSSSSSYSSHDTEESEKKKNHQLKETNKVKVGVNSGVSANPDKKQSDSDEFNESLFRTKEPLSLTSTTKSPSPGIFSLPKPLVRLSQEVETKILQEIDKFIKDKTKKNVPLPSLSKNTSSFSLLSKGKNEEKNKKQQEKMEKKGTTSQYILFSH